MRLKKEKMRKKIRKNAIKQAKKLETSEAHRKCQKGWGLEIGAGA